jgi:hypothetical protein
MSRIYRSFEEFEREELHRLDRFYDSIDDVVDDMFALDFEGGGHGRGGRRRSDDDDE